MNYVDKWINTHIATFSKEFSNNRNYRLNKKLIEVNFLGTRFLEQKVFFDFEIWYSKMLFEFSKQQLDFAKATPLPFFEYAGQISAKKHNLNTLGPYLSELEGFLTSLDPLSTTLNLLKSSEYNDLLYFATSYKIRGSSKVTLKLSDLLQQFFLLSRRTDQIKLLSDGDFELFEIQGAHLSIIDLLVKVNSQLSSAEIEVAVSDEVLSYTIIKPRDKPEECLPMLKNNTLWNVLEILLPITDVNENESRLVISVPAIITNKVRIDTLNIWWSFVLQGASSVAANDMIAAMLHSLKNDILGYSVTAQLAQSLQSNRERYQLAADASNHIERAMTNLRAVRSLSSDTVKPDISLVRISVFFRSLISTIWSRIPEAVNLDFTSTESSIEIFTNKKSLHSILENLIKNSVESLGGSGYISVKYSVDLENDGVEFLVSDSGAGFNEEQLTHLNSGAPVKSSKKNGHGLGLLTIILLTKELNGNLKFFNGDEGGANINVWIPSSPPIDEGE